MDAVFGARGDYGTWIVGTWRRSISKPLPFFVTIDVGNGCNSRPNSQLLAQSNKQLGVKSIAWIRVVEVSRAATQVGVLPIAMPVCANICSASTTTWRARLDGHNCSRRGANLRCRRWRSPMKWVLFIGILGLGWFSGKIMFSGSWPMAQARSGSMPRCGAYSLRRCSISHW